MRDEFTLGGKITVVDMFFDQAYLGGKASIPEWSVQVINEFRRQVRERKPIFNYDNAPLYEFFDKHADLVSRKRGLVVGSENPWLESMLLEFGASHVSTLEFGEIVSSHPQISTFTPQEFTHRFLNGEIAQFDFAFTYSSLEHDGLGRYGDVLNPSGDLQTMAKLLMCVKPGGYVMIGFPCCHDRLDWNAHRIYGPLRLPLLFAGYKILGVYPSQIGLGTGDEYGFQPVWLLQNRWGCQQQRLKWFQRMLPHFKYGMSK